MDGTATAPEHLHLQDLPGILPLDDQFGVWPPRTHPEALTEALFGGDAATYAIIDAARIDPFPGPEMFAPNRVACLYRGDAAEDFAATAPYLVQIGPEDRVLQRLMTRGDGPHDLWDKSAALFLRSNAPMPKIWAHLRRFIKVRDPHGAWFYLRFWDSAVAASVLRAMADEPSDLGHFFDIGGAAELTSVIALTPDSAQQITPHFATPPPRRAFILKQSYRQAFDSFAADQFFANWAETLVQTTAPLSRAYGVRNAQPFAAMTRAVAEQVAAFDVTKRSDLARLSVVGAYYGTYFMHDPRLSATCRTHLIGSRFASVNVKSLDLALRNGPLHHMVTTVAGLTEVLNQLPDAMFAHAPLQKWLDRVMHRDWGFTDQATRAQFLRICHEQQAAVGIHATGPDNPRVRSHLLLALLYGPYVLADPMHHSFVPILRGTRFSDQLSAELERRLALMKEENHG